MARVETFGRCLPPESGKFCTLFYNHTNARFMAEYYRRWVIQLDSPARIAPYLRFIGGSDPALIWRDTRITRLPAFDRLPAPVIS